MNLTAEPEVILGLIAVVAGITIHAFIKSRHNERMLQMELGITPENVQRSYFEIKFGLLFIGIGMGILTAFILDRLYISDAFAIYPAFIFLFGGLGLLASIFIVQGYKRRQ